MVLSQHLLPLILKIAYELFVHLVNPLWDALPKHDMDFKTCNSITLQDLFNLKSMVMGNVVIDILHKYIMLIKKCRSLIC
jgi:hypothetical protein